MGLTQLEAELDATADYYRRLACTRLIVPWVPPELRTDWHALARRLGDIAQKLARFGMCLGYHHHDFEFARVDGQRALDVLLANPAAADCFVELDTAWVHAGGEDAIAYIQKYAGRCPLIHLKDFSRDTDGKTIDQPVGRGELHLPGLFAAARDAGVQWALVELDRCPDGSMATARACIEHLMAGGFC